ncbi:MAG: GntR family transcriptional regulator [Anaerolineaceae bacterium]|nr:GntR family transcriptional regulator [Anaerolineaceae bacterium]
MTTKNKFIDPYSYVPKYHQMFTILRTKIENGEWQPKSPIPPERELEKLYNVSRTTIRQALSMLQDHGYIYRELGRGTFVTPPKLQNSLHVLTSFSDDMKERGLKPSHRILNLKYVEPSKNVRTQLELPESAETVFMLERLRFADGIPIGIHVSYLPLNPGQTITVDEVEEYGSLYNLLQEKFNLIATEADETLEATIADAYEAQLLEVNTGSPLLLIERTVWSQARYPMEFVKVLYRADRYKYFVHLNR